MKIYQEIPPKVEYYLTDLEISFVPVLEYMKQWGKTYLSNDKSNPY
ncbi:winged helix-turn-helix transcriptional regulator [Clostridioides difficile]